MSYPSYSVLMSVYSNDRAEFVSKSIDSMVSQTLPPDDYVIVCDGPIDDEVNRVLLEFQASRPKLFQIIKLSENQGLGKALSIGLTNCRFEIIARMDSDDIARPYRCEKQITRLVDDNLDLIGGAIEEFNTEPGDLALVRYLPTNQADIKKYSKTRNPFNHMTVIFLRSAVELAGGYRDFSYMEDYYLWVRMIACGCKCANIEDIVVDARVGNGMYERRSNRQYMHSQFAFFKELYEMGYISKREACVTLAARFATSYVPIGVVKKIYSRFLRKKQTE